MIIGLNCVFISKNMCNIDEIAVTKKNHLQYGEINHEETIQI